MEHTVILTNSDGEEQEITEKRHPDWEKLGEPCPECGETEYRHFSAGGGRYGVQQDVVIQRSDYWGTNRPLMTQCRSCEVVLYRHPAFEIIYELSEELDYQ